MTQEEQPRHIEWNGKIATGNHADQAYLDKCAIAAMQAAQGNNTLLAGLTESNITIENWAYSSAEAMLAERKRRMKDE